MGLFLGVDNKARSINNIYLGVDGKARKVIKAYKIDEEGYPRLIYSADPDTYLSDFIVPANATSFEIERR